MKLVIDIDEHIIKHLKDGSFGVRPYDKNDLIDAVMNGTPLPKGHGRLIDADALIEQIKKFRCTGCDNYNGVRGRACQYDDEMADIDDAPTIIKADKPESEDKE